MYNGLVGDGSFDERLLKGELVDRLVNGFASGFSHLCEGTVVSVYWG